MTPYPEDTKWLAYVRVDHGKHSTVEHRYPQAGNRRDAIARAAAALLPSEHLNGVSLIPADEYWKLNSAN